MLLSFISHLFIHLFTHTYIHYLTHSLTLIHNIYIYLSFQYQSYIYNFFNYLLSLLLSIPSFSFFLNSSVFIYLIIKLFLHFLLLLPIVTPIPLIKPYCFFFSFTSFSPSLSSLFSLYFHTFSLLTVPLYTFFLSF